VNLILFGPPGAGKGTQGDNLIKDYNLIKISTGDLLRQEIKKENKLGFEIKSIIDKGEFVSDELINALIEEKLKNKKDLNKLIFDGYPRNLNQAKKFDLLLKKYNQKLSCVISLEIDKNIILKRIKGRQICSSCGLIFNKYYNIASSNNHKCDPSLLIARPDDNINTIENRYDTYTKETFPIKRYYINQNLLHEIDGSKEIDQIYKEIRTIIDPLET
jgi:adenylate kinase